ncbi:MAG: CinA family nicotinamide mononucleotide deamidase-related protein [Gammaproteobacteria bacterium]|nr:CinA family nicotinamide mononucleotide deamidase-related protein [Gammaproteobacteria bacterium]
MKISLLLTGNELMSGDTVDTNSNYIAQSLKDLNLVPYIKKVVGDDLALLVASIKELSEVSDVLIINGGLGPTVDDLTAKALSIATDSPLYRHPEALQKLEEWAAPRNFVLTRSNLKQADLPENCEIIENPRGSAVGFHCLYAGCLIVCTPGVPGEFKSMVEKQVLPLIRQHGQITDTSTISRLRLFGITESGLQDMVTEKFPDWPPEVELGFRVQMPVIEIKVATVGEEFQALNQIWTDKFTACFADYLIGRDSTRLTEALNNALLDRNLTLTVAESCTGGLIAAGITSEAGSSKVFEAGFVVYSNQIKQRVLGVSGATLEQHGAVSKQVVLEMANGALEVSGADLALSISGIAGPDGGSEEKPVGTVWIAWGKHGSIRARKFLFPVARLAFQRTATAIAMDLVRRELLGLPTDTDYFSELKRKRQSG